jgi:hypothetical protein
VRIAPDGTVLLFQDGLAIERPVEGQAVLGAICPNEAEIGNHAAMAAASEALRRWYDQLRFDPFTMGQEDLIRL